MRRAAFIAFLSVGALASGGLAAQRLGAPLTNPTAFIPPQCYTQTRDASGGVHNPCFTCHVRGRRPNAINDQDLQLSYAFPGPALENRWTNLFEDRTARVNAISDADILAYVRSSNYLEPDGSLRLANRLAHPPAGWDVNGNGTWDGYRPDAYFRFDAEGYDLAPDGTRTGWRAFAYTPLPGSFSPASGSTDDVLIRLPEAYRQDADGNADWTAYRDQPRHRRSPDHTRRRRHRSGRRSTLRRRPRQGRHARARRPRGFRLGAARRPRHVLCRRGEGAAGGRRGAACRRALSARHRVRSHRALRRRRRRDGRRAARARG